MNRTTQGKTDLLLCRYSVNRPGLTIESNIRRARFVHRITIKVCGGFNLAQVALELQLSATFFLHVKHSGDELRTAT